MFSFLKQYFWYFIDKFGQFCLFFKFIFDRLLFAIWGVRLFDFIDGILGIIIFLAIIFNASIVLYQRGVSIRVISILQSDPLFSIIFLWFFD
jgi:hypothetical protein